MPEYARAELVAAAWDDKPQLDAFTSSFGIKGYADYRELLERENVDIVHIASPVARIPEVTIHCAGVGKHIVLGKPMAMSVSDADRMVDAVERAGVVCMPFQGIMRLRGTELKKRVDAGEIGDVILLHQTSRWSIAEDWYSSGKPGWFADPRQVPGGAFIDEGIYWIDFFRWISSSEVTQVDAKSREPRSQGHRGGRLGNGDVHLRQRHHRHPRGGMDHQRAAEERSLAETECCGPLGDHRQPRRDG